MNNKIKKLWSMWVAVFILLALLLILKSNTNVNQVPAHECSQFIKTTEQYQITPLSWWTRDCFKCIECGNTYLNISEIK